jgi:broad specificity phosphatase PhoE
MSTIYLIRHGQASFDADDYDQLSPLGEEQSRLLGDWLRNTGQALSKVVMGTAKRHRQTAVQCLNQYRLNPDQFPESAWIVDAGFDEFDHQEVLLKHSPEFADFAALKKFVAMQSNPRRAFQELFSAALTRWIAAEFDDYTESWLQFQTRCQAALARLRMQTNQENRDQNIWVFTSGGTISALVQSVLDIPDQRIFNLNATLMNTGLTKFIYGAERISLSYLNSPAHLEIHNRAELISYR